MYVGFLLSLWKSQCFPGILFSRLLAGGNESSEWPKESSKAEKTHFSVDYSTSEIKEEGLTALNPILFLLMSFSDAHILKKTRFFLD